MLYFFSGMILFYSLRTHDLDDYWIFIQNRLDFMTTQIGCKRYRQNHYKNE